MTLTSDRAAEQRHAPRVLIVDDTDDARALLRIRLTVDGEYVVVGEALDGEDAVRQARELQPELILLDMAMPGMHGLEALPLLRAAAPDAKVVVLTVYQPGAREEQALAVGADRYVVKGGRIRDLMTVIHAVLAP